MITDGHIILPMDFTTTILPIIPIIIPGIIHPGIMDIHTMDTAVHTGTDITMDIMTIIIIPGITGGTITEPYIHAQALDMVVLQIMQVM